MVDDVIDLAADCAAQLPTAANVDEWRCNRSCHVQTCASGSANCDGQDANGCETTLDTVPHCAACDDCSEAPTCVGTSVRTYDSPSSCQAGVCTRSSFTETPCPGGANAQPACSGGHCALNCATGFADCDGQLTTGCEASLDALPSCGTCGEACSSAPPPMCVDATTLRTFTSPGACTASACSYASADTSCAQRCWADACVTASHTCPTGLPGPALVPVDGYCMDATEVTNAQYAAFLAASPSTTGQLPECSWNSTYTPSNWPVSGKDTHPVVYVDWCDAYAYCTWAGKRLCGKIGGGSNAWGDDADASQSQWYNACSAGGTLAYPYGDTYSGTACNGPHYGGSGTLPAGQASACEGGYPGLFDLSGNVFEWEDACTSTTGAGDYCRVRGGYFGSDTLVLVCHGDGSFSRDHADGIVGFRCCSG